MFRPSRTRRGSDPTLGLRMLLFALGAVTGLSGMATERSWLVTIGTVFLGIGLLLSMREWKRTRNRGDEQETGPDESNGSGA